MPQSTPTFKSAFVYLLGLVLSLQCNGPDTEPGNPAELWQSYPDRLRSLFTALDPEAPGLSEMQAALQKGDTVGAAESLLSYYQQVDRSWVVSTLDPSSDAEAMEMAKLITHDSVNISSVKDRVPVDSDGGWQWDYTGPQSDDEFGYSLNGHQYMTSLWKAWRSSGNQVYAEIFDRLIKDWVIKHPLPASGDSIYLVLEGGHDLDYRDLGEVEWRTLETGNRLGASWTQLFYGFQSSPEFSQAARLLMLSGIADQANYLLQYHKKGHNWTTMEMNGLALAGLAFPEFKAANQWADYALRVMEQEINRQVYPDGVQTELSTKTQWVALHRFESVATNFQKAGREISQDYLYRVEEMYNYMAYSLRPDGHQPLNNDSDREDLRPRILAAAEKFDRPDWVWIVTTGHQGREPDSLPSVVFPWAGIHVMRNGWDEQAHWSFFDTGPFGTGHQHADKLHLSIAAYGHDLLVDGGRYTHMDYFSFDPTNWRGYFRSSFSHNVILVDGKGQNGGPTTVDQPMMAGIDFFRHPRYEFAEGTHTAGFEGLSGDIEHRRSVLYLRDKYWVVVDQLVPDGERELQVLWHFAPSCEVVLQQNEVVTLNQDQANLRIVPAGDIPWRVKLVSGQEKPVIQGWYSAEYGIKVPNATAIYETNVAEPVTFAWVLVPSQAQVPQLSASMHQSKQAVHVAVTIPDENPVTISFTTTGPPEISH